MGHIRLGNLPRTRKWSQVVGLIEGGAGTAQVANATIHAAERGLGFAAQDKGVVETIGLLTQLPLAARSDHFADALRDSGLSVSDSPGLLEIVAAVSEAIDAKMPNCKGRIDLGEMAQMAAAETLTGVVGGRTRTLFGTTPEDVQQSFSKLATAKQFSIFAKDFFARLPWSISPRLGVWGCPLGETWRLRKQRTNTRHGPRGSARHNEPAVSPESVPGGRSRCGSAGWSGPTSVTRVRGAPALPARTHLSLAQQTPRDL